MSRKKKYASVIIPAVSLFLLLFLFLLSGLISLGQQLSSVSPILAWLYGLIVLACLGAGIIWPIVSVWRRPIFSMYMLRYRDGRARFYWCRKLTDNLKKNTELTNEEMKVVNETRKILHLDEDVKISCTAARVPVFNGHSEAVDIEFGKEITPDEVRSILENAYGVKVIDNPENYEYPTTRDASGVNPVFVGRIRKNLAFNNGISLWCVADNIRIGAALNTVRICKKVIEMGLF